MNPAEIHSRRDEKRKYFRKSNGTDMQPNQE
jgi:hypothetical protein